MIILRMFTAYCVFECLMCLLIWLSSPGPGCVWEAGDRHFAWEPKTKIWAAWLSPSNLHKTQEDNSPRAWWESVDFIRVGPHPRAPGLSGHCRISVGTAGLQLRAPDLSGHCRTSTASSRSRHCQTTTASSRSQWALPGARSQWAVPMPERMSE